MNPKRRAVIREIAFARRTMRGPTFGEGDGGQVDENQPDQSGGFIEPVQHAPAKQPSGDMEYFLGLAPGVALTGAVLGGITGAIVGGKGRRLRAAAIGAGSQALIATGLFGVGIAVIGVAGKK